MAESVSLEEVYHELKQIEKKMVTKKEIDSLIETMAVLSNPEAMKQLAESSEDIRAGRVKPIHSVQDLLQEL